ncbi:MAG: hypothetical protein Q4B94_01800 [Pseudomonadota bacterium]|nr:hypothetical protein [Pseudomonadota bacterium]
MDFVSSLNTALSTLVSATTLAKGMMDARDFTENAARLVELYQKLLQAHEQLLLSQQEMDRLHTQIHSLTAQLADRGNYQLADLGGGVYVYQAIQAATPHYLCQPCFDAGRKAVLQNRGAWCCPLCQTRYGGGKAQPNVMIFD